GAHCGARRMPRSGLIAAPHRISIENHSTKIVHGFLENKSAAIYNGRMDAIASHCRRTQDLRPAARDACGSRAAASARRINVSDLVVPCLLAWHQHHLLQWAMRRGPSRAGRTLNITRQSGEDAHG